MNNITNEICSNVANCTLNSEWKVDAPTYGLYAGGKTEAFCECPLRFIGPACSFACPIDSNGQVCAGVGVCTFAGCECKSAEETESGKLILVPTIVYANHVVEPVATPGYVNNNCNVSCPIDIYGRYCSGNGMCSDGACYCNFGYSGDECESISPQMMVQASRIVRGGPVGTRVAKQCPICSNSTFCCNGDCNRALIATQGFGCKCDDGFRGLGCETECPFTEFHLNAYGDAEVDSNTYCAGSAAEPLINGVCNEAAKCECQSYARGYDCSLLCPRSRMAEWNQTVCSSHGVCDAGAACGCDFGFKGRACHFECPKTDGIVCSNHGTCDENANSAFCKCDDTYRGAACQMRCPVDDFGNACYNHGECDASAKCHCIRGYMGSSCQTSCERCPISNRLCCHGRCKYTGECMCEIVNGTEYTGTTCELTVPELRIKNHTHTMATEKIKIKMDYSGQNFGICANKLRLNGPYSNQLGYAFDKTSQSVYGGFTTKFQFQINDRSVKCRHIRNSFGDTYFYDHCYEKGADGFAFLLSGSDSHRPDSALASIGFTGQNGKHLGYGGVNNSLAVEFDTWWNEDLEGNVGMSPHISVNARATAPNSADHKYSLGSAPIPRLGNSLVKTVIIKYTPGNFSLAMVNEDVIDNDRTSVLSPGHVYASQYTTQQMEYQCQLGLLEVFFDDLEVPVISIPLDMRNLLALPDEKAYVGFTSGTDEHFQTHDILQWYFCEGLDCTSKDWLEGDTENAFSYCNSVPCPRGYPWQHYPANTSTTELGATT